MPSKIWGFALEDGAHLVELEYSFTSARERFFVDGALVSDEHRYVLLSRYRFSIGEHECLAVLRLGWGYVFELFVDGRLVEMLPSQSLLRPAQPEAALSAHLLRASEVGQETPPEDLLRTTTGEE